MLIDEVRERVEKATVRLPEKGGLGVVVPSGLILTAAHCIEWSSEGDMALGGYYLETVECAGRRIRATILAVEPVSDIAVLGSPLDRGLYNDAIAYEEALELVAPLKMNTDEFVLFQNVAAAVYTHRGAWIEATAQQCSDGAPCLWIAPSQEIVGGTSGGPIVDQHGCLLGVVSDCSTGQEPTGKIPRPHLALPVWIVKRISAPADKTLDGDE